MVDLYGVYCYIIPKKFLFLGCATKRRAPLLEAVRSRKSRVKLVNAASTGQTVTITLSGLGGGTQAQLDTLKANTITHPDRIVAVRSKLVVQGEFLEQVLPAYSIRVLEIDRK